jgi:hypothetical protein
MTWAPFAVNPCVIASPIGICAGCGGSVQPTLAYKPLFLPFALTYGPKGFGIQGSTSFATAIGEFSIGAQYQLPPQKADSIYVILRDRRTGYDQIFEVQSGGNQFAAVVNGTTTISIANNQVLIDVTNGTIKKITFKRVTGQVSEQDSSWFVHTWHATSHRWDEGWAQSWYRPYGLTKWAYSDSTINRWYGIGFVWFLIRLILAIILSLIDTVLSVGFLLGQAGFLLFGPTGRDAIYGLLVLGTLAAIGIGLSSL